ncbi:cell division protein SepF [Aliterella atlantica]|uniref:cell division protein SepF n=1 Tax=Aliterella atlantica TaxID=1827278 RepID=UPI000695D9AF|nr:cell division protein SepF [Aliterella atlantica]
MEPYSFQEVTQAIEALMQYQSVVMNLSKMEPEQAQRAVDFVTGATYALAGNQEQLGEGIFIFMPGNTYLEVQ